MKIVFEVPAHLGTKYKILGHRPFPLLNRLYLGNMIEAGIDLSNRK